MRFQRRWGMAVGPLIVYAILAAPLPASDNFLPPGSKYTGVEASIPLSDGKRLAADVYLPKSAKGALPAVLVQTPYNKNQYRGVFKGPAGGGKQSLYGLADCAVVFTDWRGRNASADALTSEGVPGGTADGLDTLDWIAAQSWSNGKVGTWGPSALGRVQYMTAKGKHPAHVCAAPSVMPLNLTHEIYFPGGALWEEFVSTLKRLGWDRRQWLIENPVNGEFWREQERTTFVSPADMQIPMLIYGGWFDIYTDSVIETYRAVRSGGGESARKHSRLVMGPWVHAADDSPKQGELVFDNSAGVGMRRSLEFLGHWLRSEANGAADEPAVAYYQMGDNEWRASADWPPPGSKEADYWLTPDKALSPAANGGKPGEVAFAADPANPVPTIGGHLIDPANGRGPLDQREKVERREDAVAVFSTGVLDQDLAVAGRPIAALQVSTDGPDTDFVALLTDVHPDGRSMLIGEGIQRLRFREGTGREVLAEPGKVYSIEIKLQNTAITFKKGHRVRLIAASSSSPHWAVNPNDGGLMYDGHAGRVATNTIHLGGERGSRLVLPVMGR